MRSYLKASDTVENVVLAPIDFKPLWETRDNP